MPPTWLLVAAAVFLYVQYNKTKRNPTGLDSAAQARRILASAKPGDRPAIRKALRLSQEFHGTPGQVVKLSAKERKLPKYAVVAGDLAEFSYIPGASSKRGEMMYSHESGDRGEGKPVSDKTPLLVVDPETRRPVIVPRKSPMRFSGRRGWVG